MRRSVAAVLALLSVSCGDSSKVFIASRWKYMTAADAAPPGVGPERRVVVATKAGQGSLGTLSEENGRPVEGPFSQNLFPTDHAPLAAATTIFIVSSIGKVVAVSFAGEQKFSKPSAPLLATGPLASAPDGSLRIASNSGRLVALRAADGETIFDTPIGGAAPSPLAIGTDGTTYVATDSGHVVAIDPTGAKVFDVMVQPPASGPSVTREGGVLVGEGNGLRAFDGQGREVFRHPRAARVVGTRTTSRGELMAWGEDGVFELLDANGGTIATFRAGPPIYAPVVALKNGKFGVIDSSGVAHLVNREGKEEARLMLDAPPLAEVAVGQLGWVFVAAGRTVSALDFTAM